MRQLFWWLVVAAVLCMPVTEVLRSIVHRRRERVHGIGGTQDIAMAGVIVFALLTAAAIAVVIVGDLFPRR